MKVALRNLEPAKPNLQCLASANFASGEDRRSSDSRSNCFAIPIRGPQTISQSLRSHPKVERWCEKRNGTILSPPIERITNTQRLGRFDWPTTKIEFGENSWTILLPALAHYHFTYCSRFERADKDGASEFSSVADEVY